MNNDYRQYFTKGVEAFSNQKYKIALEYFQAIISEKQHHIEAHLYLADCYVQLHDEKRALSILHRLLSFDPYNDAAQQRLHKVCGENTTIPEQPHNKQTEGLQNQTQANLHGYSSQTSANSTITIKQNVLCNKSIYADVEQIKTLEKNIKKQRRKTQLLQLNVFKKKTNRTKINAINSFIESNEKLLKKIKIDDYFDETNSIEHEYIKGRIFIHNTDQTWAKAFDLGHRCKKIDKAYQKWIEHLYTFAIGRKDWQCHFFTNMMLFETKKQFMLIPYTALRCSYNCVYNEGVHAGYEVTGKTWYHARKDGGPDLRYNNNFQIDIICRHQVSVYLKDKHNELLCFMFDTKYDAKRFVGLFSTLKKTQKALSVAEEDVEKIIKHMATC